MKLFDAANRYLTESTWKTLAALKFCLLSLGVIGEYVGKLYNETKHRPRFIVDRYLNRQGDDPVVDR